MMNKIINHQYFQFLCRLVLGGVFIYAAVDKVLDPGAFARSVANYRILTDPLLVNLTGLLLPWLELVAGILLVLGLWRKGSVLVLGGLTVVFIILISVTMIRGIDIECGCFGGAAASRVGWGHLFIDLSLLIPAVFIYLGLRKPLPESSPLQAEPAEAATGPA